MVLVIQPIILMQMEMGLAQVNLLYIVVLSYLIALMEMEMELLLDAGF